MSHILARRKIHPELRYRKPGGKRPIARPRNRWEKILQGILKTQNGLGVDMIVSFGKGQVAGSWEHGH